MNSNESNVKTIVSKQDAIFYEKLVTIDGLQSHITKLEAQNKELREALGQIPNLVRRGSIGTAAKIAEQALKL